MAGCYSTEFRLVWYLLAYTENSTEGNQLRPLGASRAQPACPKKGGPQTGACSGCAMLSGAVAAPAMC